MASAGVTASYAEKTKAARERADKIRAENKAKREAEEVPHPPSVHLTIHDP